MLTSAQPKPPSPTATKKVDINTAKLEELKTLHGVTDEIAKKIIAARPFKAPTELVTKKIMTEDSFRKVLPIVTASPTNKGGGLPALQKK